LYINDVFARKRTTLRHGWYLLRIGSGHLKPWSNENAEPITVKIGITDNARTDSNQGKVHQDRPGEQGGCVSPYG
jgi:hypothetical protein